MKSETIKIFNGFSNFTNLGGVKNIAYTISYYLIAGVLLFSGISKLFNPYIMIDALKNIFNSYEEILIVLATLLPVYEIGLGVFIIFKIEIDLIMDMTLLLFMVFLIFSIYGVVIGVNYDCGCFGDTITNKIGWGMVLRNILLVFIMLLLKYKSLYIARANLIK